MLYFAKKQKKGGATVGSTIKKKKKKNDEYHVRHLMRNLWYSSKKNFCFVVF